ncbi:TIR domain-containing protein [Macrococcus psychrotolerans]
MGRKIFVSYKYADESVYPINQECISTPRHYINEFVNKITNDVHIYKGEEDGNDLSEFKDGTIETRLKEKIFDSSLTIVFISPNMRDFLIEENDQWIPWEISYSLRDKKRNGKMSKANALLGIVLPDSTNDYSYVIKDNTCEKWNCRTIDTSKLFSIMKNNTFNIKNPTFSECDNHYIDKVYLGKSSYMKLVKWKDFINNINVYVDKAFVIRENIEEYNIYKSV